MRNRIRKLFAGAFVLILHCGMAIAAGGQVIVSPGAYAAADGNSDNTAPFDIAFFAIASMRYQQVYNASEFGALMGPALLTQISFRPDGNFGAAFSATLPNVQINLSTTTTTAAAISTIFAANVGADDVVVHSGPISMSSAFVGPAGGAKEFDIVISLTTPFLYDPAAGNLLLDVRNFGGGLTTGFDATYDLNGGINRVLTLNGGSVNDPIGHTEAGATYGLVTQFTFRPEVTAVPEPGSAVWLGGVVLSVVLATRCFRRALARESLASVR